MEKIALDAHKRYSLMSVERRPGEVVFEGRIEHRRGAIEGALRHREKRKCRQVRGADGTYEEKSRVSRPAVAGLGTQPTINRCARCTLRLAR
jgi:hypothetical protein